VSSRRRAVGVSEGAIMTRRSDSIDPTTQVERASSTREADRRRSRWNALATGATAFWLATLIGLLITYGLVQSQRLRTLIVSGFAILLLLGLAVGTMWVVRAQKTVPRVIALIFLITIMLLTSLLPVIFLGTTDRILLLKLGAIGFLSLFPGLLYVQFVAVRVETLWTEYVINLHRLQFDKYENLPQPPATSLFRRAGETSRDDASNLYRQKFVAAYGVHIPAHGGASVDPSDRSSLLPKGSLLPMGLCTVLLAVGWTMIVQPEPISTDQLLRSVTLSGQPILPEEALRFAFLGAYVFAIEVLIRRYFQDDLKPGAYLTCAGRILTAILFVAAIHQVWPWDAGQEAAFAFVVGVFPMVGVRALQGLVSFPLRGLLPNLNKKYPLSQIDGLNIWYESRLLEEGIEDMQNLATANIVDVMLRTRVPVGRLVDWIDQALLDLKVEDDDEGSDRAKLRRLGIRTATDLEDVVRPSTASPWVSGYGQTEPEGFLSGLQRTLNTSQSEPSVMIALWKSLAREPNLYHVRRYKEIGNRLHAAWAAPGDEDRPVPALDVPTVVHEPQHVP
jgi:hypothetical protein